MPHPNRSNNADNPGRNPKPEEMRAAREARGMTPTEAARLCFNTGQWWEDCEAGKKRCHPAIWQFWLSRVMHEANLQGERTLSAQNARLVQRVLQPTGRTAGELTLDDLGRLLDAAREEGRCGL